jgi:hypothetical protein
VSAVREDAPALGKAGAGSYPYTAGDDRDFARQALADAIIYRAMAAAEPCPACAVHRALLCVAHAAELDWVSAYRAMLAAMP